MLFNDLPSLGLSEAPVTLAAGTTKPNSDVLMFGRSSLFNRALTACGKLRVRHPENVAIKSIIAQLQYLIEVESGRNADRSRLDTIVIGVLARREVEPLDIKTAKLLEKVAEEAWKMEAAAAADFADAGKAPSPGSAAYAATSWTMRR